MMPDMEAMKIILTSLYCDLSALGCHDCPSSVQGRCADQGGSLEDAIRIIRNQYGI